MLPVLPGRLKPETDCNFVKKKIVLVLFYLVHLVRSNNGIHKDGLQDELEKHNFNDKLSEAVASLPEREKMIVALYYESELNLREIGSTLNVSESRISQLLSQAHLRLRARMEDWIKDDA